MLKSICNVACQRPVGRSPGVARSEPGTRREFRGFVPRIKLAATKLITFGYFQLVAAQFSAQGLWVEAGGGNGGRGRQLFACSAKKVAQHPLTAFKAQAAKSEQEKNRRRAKRSEVLAAKNCGRLTEVTKQQQQQQKTERLQQHAKGELQRSAASDGAR